MVGQGNRRSGRGAHHLPGGIVPRIQPECQPTIGSVAHRLLHIRPLPPRFACQRSGRVQNSGPRGLGVVDCEVEKGRLVGGKRVRRPIE